MGRVIAVCISEAKGTQKKNIHRAEFIEDWGIRNDAHTGKWHRQVSLLGEQEIIDYMTQRCDFAFHTTKELYDFLFREDAHGQP